MSKIFTFDITTFIKRITWKLEAEIISLDIDITSDEMCFESFPKKYPRRDTRNALKQKIENIKSIRNGNSVPLMIFTIDLEEDDGGVKSSGCAILSGACDRSDGQNWGVVDMTWRQDRQVQRKQQMARTAAHEFGHMVYFYLAF